MDIAKWIWLAFALVSGWWVIASIVAWKRIRDPILWFQVVLGVFSVGVCLVPIGGITSLDNLKNQAILIIILWIATTAWVFSPIRRRLYRYYADPLGDIFLLEKPLLPDTISQQTD